MTTKDIIRILKYLDCPIGKGASSDKDFIEYLTKPSEKRNEFLFWLSDMSQLYCPIDQNFLTTEKKQVFPQRVTKVKNATPEGDQDIHPQSKYLKNILLCYGCCSSEVECTDILSGHCSIEVQLSSFLHLLRFLDICKHQQEDKQISASSEYHHSFDNSLDQVKRSRLLLEKVGQRSRGQNNSLKASSKTISFLPPDIKRDLAQDIAKYKRENNFAEFMRTVESSRAHQLSRINEELQNINREIKGYHDGLVDQAQLKRLKMTMDELSQLFDSFLYACDNDFDPLRSHHNGEATIRLNLSSLGPSAKRLEAQVDKIQSYFSLLKSIEEQVTAIRDLCDSVPTDSYSIINESVTALCLDLNDLVR